ncbi:MAG: TPM domain-containing protein [Allosphingosinicella sp.]
MKALLLPLLLLGSAACDAQAPAAEGQRRPLTAAPARPLPALTGRVVDNADVLGAAAEAELTARLAALEKATTDQLVVVTVPGLDGEAIEDLGLRLGNGWGVGQKGLDNGVLLIVSPADQKARIEVGKGLEGLLTDRRAARIMAKQVVTNCRQGHCERAIAEGVDAIAALLRSDRKRPQPKRRPA